MEIIKYLFEGFFITIVSMYIIGKEFDADNTVIMATAIAGILMVTESIGSIYRYSKKKIITGVHTLERQIGGMDGTMSLQTALRMKEMLQKQSGGCGTRKCGSYAPEDTAMFDSRVKSGKMKTQTDEYTYGEYANYETVYNMPQIPIDREEMELLSSEHKLPNINNLRRSISARMKQSQFGGETEKSKSSSDDKPAEDAEKSEETKKSSVKPKKKAEEDKDKKAKSQDTKKDNEE
jgi:hypothetical protein